MASQPVHCDAYPGVSQKSKYFVQHDEYFSPTKYF